MCRMAISSQTHGPNNTETVNTIRMDREKNMDTENKLFLTYDDTRSIQLKTRYAINQKLGGIMFWELLSDKPKTGLLSTMVSEAKK